MELSLPKTIFLVFLSLCVAGIFIFYDNKKENSYFSVATSNNEQVRNRDGKSEITEQDECRNNWVGKSMYKNLANELQELYMHGAKKDEIQQWIRVAWGKTESLLSAYSVDDIQFSLDNKSMDKSPSISEGLADLFESRGKSGSQLLDIAYSRGLILSLLAEIDRPAFDATLQAAIQNRGVEENINLLAILFNPKQLLDVEKIEFNVIESLIASEDELPQIISLGLIDLYLQLDLQNSEDRKRKLRALPEILGGSNWVDGKAITETRQSLIDEAQVQIGLN